MPPHALAELEVNGLSGVLRKSCKNTYTDFVSKKRKNGEFPFAKEAQVKLNDCYAETLVKANEHCGEAFKSLLECISARNPPVLKCEALRGQFVQCYESKALAP